MVGIQALNARRLTFDQQLSESIELLDANRVSEFEMILAKQHTMIWNEKQSLDISPSQRRVPDYDTHDNELSFPAIYFGVG